MGCAAKNSRKPSSEHSKACSSIKSPHKTFHDGRPSPSCSVIRTQTLSSILSLYAHGCPPRIRTRANRTSASTSFSALDHGTQCRQTTAVTSLAAHPNHPHLARKSQATFSPVCHSQFHSHSKIVQHGSRKRKQALNRNPILVSAVFFLKKRRLVDAKICGIIPFRALFLHTPHTHCSFPAFNQERPILFPLQRDHSSAVIEFRTSTTRPKRPACWSTRNARSSWTSKTVASSGSCATKKETTQVWQISVSRIWHWEQSITKDSSGVILLGKSSQKSPWEKSRLPAFSRK